MIKFILIFLSIVECMSVFGQFDGGNGNGAKMILFQNPTSCLCYLGGNYSGYYEKDHASSYTCGQYTSTGTGSGFYSKSLSEVIGSCYTMFLPIESSPLFASVIDRNGVLTWETYSEINNQGFEIQKTSDGVNWQSIGWVNGAGNSTETLKYSFTDTNLEPGDFYYRFKQIDYDGITSYSNSVLLNVNNSSSNPNMFLLYPNPSNDGQSIHINSWLDKEMETTIQLYDMLGRELAQWEHTFEKNTSIYTLPATYSSGSYYLTIVSMLDGETFKIPFTIN